MHKKKNKQKKTNACLKCCAISGAQTTRYLQEKNIYIEQKLLGLPLIINLIYI